MTSKSKYLIIIIALLIGLGITLLIGTTTFTIVLSLVLLLVAIIYDGIRFRKTNSLEDTIKRVKNNAIVFLVFALIFILVG
jgi:4-hydroxybenzoate polyprenyltransferase